MVSFFKRKRKSPEQNSEATLPPVAAEATREASSETGAGEKQSLFKRLRDRLGRTRGNLTGGIADLMLGKKSIDDELLEEIETQLLIADLGVEATQAIIEDLTIRTSREQLQDAEALMEALRENMQELLTPCNQPLIIPAAIKPFVILMVGVNGVGKTTTIGKLAKKFQAEGRSVMLAAGDTFRAAAVEQLQVWGERNQVPVMAQHSGADSASVIFDAVQSAQVRGIDVLIADTAGRLHTQTNLMEELKKVKRVMGKVNPHAPHEIMLTVDAGTGQNALNQARQFHEAVDLTGIILTKLDGTAKGGVIFAIAKKMGLPIRFIGVGEGIDDLRPFNAEEFVNALLTPLPPRETEELENSSGQPS
ncbi:signal recognition particle-docking protein FtsY [Nitrosococcus oceani ATCC 19707]|uniref:Signal recognition particle receptor FtsY n=2 Tax=Nitrosococcus oceani TaxID=1229 RepID=Q3J9V0_NITOC|nr:signal recognition particle-docking protein FtsY [Nitrosococcus oceani]ABA58396.1 signal recognition particle-docking protein FtsY [Nitrosococcus oceani ATCC 19707]EDZ66971.1 signal recognition particle-docking protein FtsY [Nitrosococcus oceani AFC27]KFI19204.1 cell division protein FtsY [Nitrosococcus oceani C-27]GEM18790.1 signal recognition particle-docking protein FtsY [Nitrosococcus oceani]